MTDDSREENYKCCNPRQTTIALVALTLFALGITLAVLFAGPKTRHCDTEDTNDLFLQCEIENTKCKNDECHCWFQILPEDEDISKKSGFCVEAGEKLANTAETVYIIAGVVTLILLLSSLVSCCCCLCC